MPGLAVRAFGPLSVSMDDARVPLAPALVVLLSALLLRRDESVHVETLADELYSGRPPRTVESAMRVHLAKLRDVLEPGRPRGVSTRLSVTSGRWRLRIEPDEFDVATFAGSVAQARVLAGSGRTAEAIDVLERGLHLWVDEPFAGIHSDAAAAERARLQTVRRSAYAMVGDLLLQLGDADRAVMWLRPARLDDPLDEGLAVLMARALAAAAGREAALSELAAYHRILRDELGLDPSHATRGLQAEILQGKHDLVVRLPARPPLLTTDALIGRRRELGLAESALDSIGVCIVDGEAGAGRTAFMRALAQRRGGIMVSAASRAGPFSLVHAVLQKMGADGPEWATLDRLVTVTDTSSGEGPDGASLAALLVTRSVGGGRLLVVDDVEYADPESAAVLHNALRTGALHLAVARRTGTVGALDALLSRAPVVTLSPLEDEEALLLAVRHSPGVDVTAADVAEAGGNPLLITYVAHHPGSGIETIAQSALAGLSDAASEALGLLGLIDHPVPFQALRRLAADEVWAELLVRRLATQTEDLLEVRGRVLAAALAEWAGPVVCARRLSMVLEAQVLPPLLLEEAVTRHGPLLDPPVLHRWRVAAGRAALAMGGAATARGHFEAAVTLGGGDDTDALLGLARATSACGDLTQGRALFARVLDRLRANGRPQAAAAVLGEYVGMLSPSSAEQWLVDATSAWILEHAGDLDGDDLTRLLDLQVAAAVGSGDLPSRVARVRNAAAESGSLTSRVIGLAAEWRASFHAGAPAIDRVALSAQAVGLASQTNDTALQVRSLRNHIDDLIAVGRRDAALATTERLREVGRMGANAQALWWTDLLDVGTLLREGDAHVAGSAAARVNQQWSRMPATLRDDALRSQLFVALFRHGQLDTLLDALRQVPPTPDDAGDGAVVLVASAALRAALGVLSDEEARDVVATAVGAPRAGRRPTVLYLAGRIASAHGIDDPRLRQGVEEYQGQWVSLGTAVATLGPMDAVCASLARVAGDERVASRRLAQAIDLCTTMHAPWWAHDAVNLSHAGPKG